MMATTSVHPGNGAGSARGRETEHDFADLEPDCHAETDFEK